VSGAVDRQFEQLVEESGKDNLIRQQIRGRLTQGLGTKEAQPAPDEDEVARQMADPTVRADALAEVRKQIRTQLLEQLQLLAPGQSRRFTFSNVPRLPEGRMLQLRYKLRPLRRPDSGVVKSAWFVQNPQSGMLAGLARDDPANTAASFDIYPQLVPPPACCWGRSCHFRWPA